jgi:hypothetical protein
MKSFINNYGEATLFFGGVAVLICTVTYMALTYGVHNPIASF